MRTGKRSDPQMQCLSCKKMFDTPKNILKHASAPDVGKKERLEKIRSRKPKKRHSALWAILVAVLVFGGLVAFFFFSG